MDQKIINLYDEYTHKPLTREVFIQRLVKLTGSTAAAMSLLPLLEVNYAHAETLSAQDGRLETGHITYQGEDAEMKGYLARPKGNKRLGGVIVIHENRGLNPHIEDVTRRMALEGFVALAPDALSPLGGTPQDEDKARDMFQQLDNTKTIKSFALAFDYLDGRKDCNGKFGCIGFCWGGAMANNLAVSVPQLRVAIPFYGRQPALEEVPKIKATMQLHYAEMDERINAGIAAYEEALKKAGKDYEIFMYKGAQHAFHNDTAPTRYNAEAARLAWTRAVDVLSKKLK